MREIGEREKTLSYSIGISNFRKFFAQSARLP
jgi:hypothetical protein